MALRSIATAATILCVMSLAAHGQSAAKTECKDGTRTADMGSHACDGHGGVHAVHTTILRRAPSGTQAQTREPARVTQAGTPANSGTATPEEHRGWRWAHHDSPEEKHRAEERRREEERRHADERRREDEHHLDQRRRAEEHRRHERVRCRDGRYEDLKEHHGKGRGPEICKHHGGIAQ